MRALILWELHTQLGLGHVLKFKHYNYQEPEVGGSQVQGQSGLYVLFQQYKTKPKDRTASCSLEAPFVVHAGPHVKAGSTSVWLTAMARGKESGHVEPSQSWDARPGR